jgi:KipI family sensor histidine kinase inhibitor
MTTLVHTVRLLPLGDAALSIELGEAIDPAVNARVIALAERIRGQSWNGVLDVVPPYRSLTIHVDPRRLDLPALMDRLRLLPVPQPGEPTSGKDVTITVLYGGAAGPDLDDRAGFANLSAADVIRLHSSTAYRVYMLGFSPGFPYLGPVPEPLAMPRLATPRPTVPAGSVGIAGRQTGIYPIASPGGWRVIGHTPFALYRPASPSPFLVSPGDVVRFVPIDATTFDRLRRESHDQS